MVNGPRPDTIATTPSSSRAVAAPSTPTVLSRQHTSIYSTASATTPVLVYGKEVTPLCGNWADEPWSPKERHAEPVGLLEVLEAPISTTAIEVDDNSSVSDETAVFNEQQSPAMFRTASDASTNAQTVATAGHVSFVFRYDPYSAAQTRTEMYRCNCEDCLDRANTVTGIDVLAAPIYTHNNAASYSETASMGHPMASYESYDHHHYGGGGSQVAVMEDVWSSAVAPQAVEVAPTPFMPPPPPPRVTRRVVAESAEPTLDAESAFYLIIMRWYDRVTIAQQNWIMNEDFCPQPDLEKYSFDEWVDEIGRWWLRNFEHIQVKTSASSGAIRAVASTVRRPAAAGFETHASGPRPVQPRRQTGTSGLTLAMLESHNEVVPPHGQSRARRELPW